HCVCTYVFSPVFRGVIGLYVHGKTQVCVSASRRRVCQLVLLTISAPSKVLHLSLVIVVDLTISLICGRSFMAAQDPIRPPSHTAAATALCFSYGGLPTVRRGGGQEQLRPLEETLFHIIT
ncbi:unnamed protein product, partial [Meganyctiphanes norvegica]